MYSTLLYLSFPLISCRIRNRSVGKSSLPLLQVSHATCARTKAATLSESRLQCIDGRYATARIIWLYSKNMDKSKMQTSSGILVLILVLIRIFCYSPIGWPDGKRLGSTPVTPLEPRDGARFNSLRLPARLHNPLLHLQSFSTNKTPIILPKPSPSTFLMSQMTTNRQQHTHLSLSKLSYADGTFRHSNTEQTEFEFNFSFFCCSF